ncbi:MAG TPA: EAL domain-containing protein [Aquihabitans sp.]|jgi:EAL domain-containing protein (putative c-di-GMP-specific phosphodiesterase class I)|nr:EAL domain-containing protein [Aquihabitans sp.]
MSMIEAYTARRTARRPRPHLVPEVPPMSFSEGVITADHAFRVRTANGPAAAVLGWDRPEDLAEHLDRTDWGILTPATRRHLVGALADRRRWEGTTTLTRRDGTAVEVVLTACSLNGSAGMPAGVVLVLRPVATTDDREPSGPDEDTFKVADLPGHFLLHYQPEVDLASGQVTSAEALLRWRHPALGLVSPGATLSQPMWAARLADLETWTHAAACRQAARWALTDHPLRVSVNLSSRQLADPALVQRIRASVSCSRVPAACLAVEIRHSDVLLRPSLVRRVVQALTAERIAVIVDHFDDSVPDRLIAGLAISELKLAPHTTKEIATSASRQRTVRALVELAHELGATTTAGMVEHAADAAVLGALGVDRAFGNHFSPPLAPDDLFTPVEIDRRTLAVVPPAVPPVQAGVLQLVR